MLDTVQDTLAIQGPADPVGTVLRFFRALDEREFDTLAPMLAPGGSWTRLGVELRSQAEIRAALADRSPTVRVHHLLTNVYAEPRGHDEAEVCGFLLVVRHDSGSEPTGPSPLTGIESIRTMRARLRRTDGGWRILRLKNDPPTFSV